MPTHPCKNISFLRFASITLYNIHTGKSAKLSNITTTAAATVPANPGNAPA